MAERQKDDRINKLKLSARKRKAVNTTNNAELSLAKSPKEDKTNNLELYLDDVYRKECVFKGEQKEVQFIQTGIEKLVQRIADLVLGKFSLTETKEEALERLKEKFVEVYFPLKNKQVKTAKSSIIKVGSFYEETKNNFPNEFDFIFLLSCVRDLNFEYDSIFNTVLVTTAKHIKTVTTAHKESLKYICLNETLNVTKSLHFNKYVRIHGPAFMFQFIYKNGSGEEKYIHADLSPAIKVNNIGDQTDWYEKFFMQNFNLHFKSLCTEVMLAKNFLAVRTQLLFTVTETEVHFMRNILSKKHVKVYRILKFLVNGHGDSEILELFFRTEMYSEEKGYSSYQIKNMMFHHHEECRNPDKPTIGDCAIQILKDMCKFSDTNQFPTVFLEGYLGKPFTLLSDLKDLLERLKSIQSSEDSYDYEKIRMKSVSKHYLDALHNQSLEMSGGCGFC